MKRAVVLGLLAATACGRAGEPRASSHEALSSGDAYAYAYGPSGLVASVAKNGVSTAIVDGPSSLVAGAVAYSYDALGRVVARGDVAFGYGPDGHVATASSPSGLDVSYVYDEAGARVAKKRGGAIVEAYVDDGLLTNEELIEVVHAGGRAVGVVRGGVYASFASDSRGTALTGTDGVQSIPSPFGDRATHPDVALAIDYAQSGWDADLGASRMGARDYDPAIARFREPDPKFLRDPSFCIASPLECNLYGYARNAPADFVDASGTNALSTGDWAHPTLVFGVGWGPFGVRMMIDAVGGNVYFGASKSLIPSILPSLNLGLSIPYRFDDGHLRMGMTDREADGVIKGGSYGGGPSYGPITLGVSRTIDGNSGTFDLGWTQGMGKKLGMEDTKIKGDVSGSWTSGKIHIGADSLVQHIDAAQKQNDTRDSIWFAESWKLQTFGTPGYINGKTNPTWDPSRLMCEPSDYAQAPAQSIAPMTPYR